MIEAARRSCELEQCVRLETRALIHKNRSRLSSARLLSRLQLMFGFRKVGPPLTTFQRVDIELLMRKTIETVGEKEVLEADVVTDLRQLRLGYFR